MSTPAPHSAALTEELTVRWTRAQPTVSAYLSSCIANFQDVEDVLQEVAMAIARQYADSDRSRPFVPWAMGIARHKALDYHRKQKRDPHFFDDELLARVEKAYEEIGPEIDPLRQALDKCMSKLQERGVKLLEMRYTRNLTPARIADMTGTTANAVTVMLHRVRAALAKCINSRINAARGGA